MPGAPIARDRCFPRKPHLAWLRRIAALILPQALLLMLFGGPAFAQSGARVESAAAPNIAIYYGKNVPFDELAAFDIVVVEPGNVRLPARREGEVRGRDARPNFVGRSTELFAYVSVGEVHPTRDYATALPREWQLGENTAWGSIVVDQSKPEWAEFFASRVIAPLWAQGYRGFFLDTLDSFNIVAKTDATREAQIAGLSHVIETIRARFPGAKLIFNRGFEILPRVNKHAYAVAAESLFRGWDASKKTYREVPAADREWLLGQLNRVKNDYKLPVIAIDYVAPSDRALARDTAKKIDALGFTPWVSNPDLDAIGVGRIEVMPRDVLVLYDPSPGGISLRTEEAHRLIDMPLNWLGYGVEHLATNADMPAHPLAGRYAGVVAWLRSDNTSPRAREFIASAIAQGVKVAVFGGFGAPVGEGLARLYGLKSSNTAASPQRLSAEVLSPLAGFEVKPVPDRSSFYALEASGGTPLVRVKSERGEVMEPAAIMPWGGYAVYPFAIYSLPGDQGVRWVVNPIGFLREALALPLMPVPDLTTENGRRLMLVHVDGDGFPSRAEVSGAPFAGEVMLREFVERYRVPSTISVIEAELAPDGLYPKDSPALEAIAKRIFAMANVEIASHSYSHPFKWGKAEAKSGKAPDGKGPEDRTAESYNLSIPGYTFDIKREVNGSLGYIDRRLAPPGKSARVFLWTGDCDPGEDSVERTYEAGVFNMNGGETLITRASPSLSLVAPIGLRRGEWFQVYAPNQNENVYTNLWTGPFYGFERVIETFELTERPRRLKPINIYYHTYAASKRASIAALHKVYRWALDQKVMNIYASEYAAKAIDFMRMTVSRNVVSERPEWIVRGAGDLRTLRLPSSAGFPDLAASRSIAGHADHEGERYLHLAGGEARIRLSSAAATRPWLADANARISALTSTADGLAFTLTGHMPLAFSIGAATGCEVLAGGRAIAPVSPATAGTLAFQLKTNGTETISVRCRR